MQRHRDALVAIAVFALTFGLTVIAFPPFRLPEFAYVMMLPACLWAYRRPPWKLFVPTVLGAQAIAWTVLLGWLHHVTWGGLLLLGPFIGIWVGSWYLAVWWTMPRLLGQRTAVRLIAILGLGGLWVLIEWTRTWLLGGFPWLPLAASQWERTSILQVASYTGAYGVSFVLAMANLGFAAYAHRLFFEDVRGINRRSQEFFLALFLLLTCVSLHFTEVFNRRGQNERLGRIGLVQPYIEQDVKWDPARLPAILDVLERTTLQAAKAKPDLLVWPEASTPLAVRGHDSARSFVESLVQRAGAPLLLGSVAIERPGSPEEEWRNGAFLATPDSGLLGTYYSKRKLVPFGEFVPLRPLLGWIDKFVPVGGDFAAGETASPLLVPLGERYAIFGPLICYEDIYPQLARDSVLSGAQALAVLTNNGWFGEGGAAYQHAAHSVLRAVENRRPVIRCGNGGWSGWIDEFGVVRRTLTNEKGTIYFRGAQIVEVQRDRRWTGQNTVYTQYGDWFVLVSALLAGAGFLLLRTAVPR